MITLLLFAFCILILLLVVRHVRNAGYFDKVEIEVVEKPKLIGQNLEIFYKHHIGPYKNTGEYVKEIQSLVADKNAKIISIYYDNPKVVNEHLCQSITGVISTVDDNAQIEPHFASNLTRWGYERVRLPAVERSVVCRQRFNGLFSYFHLIWHVYPKLNKFFEEQRIETHLTIEILTGTNLTIYCPLDHTEEFRFDGKIIPTDKLEEKLALGEFQTTSNDDSEISDEEDSDFDEDEVQTEDENSQLLNA